MIARYCEPSGTYGNPDTRTRFPRAHAFTTRAARPCATGLLAMCIIAASALVIARAVDAQEAASASLAHGDAPTAVVAGPAATVMPRRMIAAPSLVQMNVADAMRVASKYHLKLVIAEKGRAGYGPVIESQSPPADTPMVAGGTITVHLRQVLAYGSTAGRDVLLRGMPGQTAEPETGHAPAVDLNSTHGQTPYSLELPIPPAAPAHRPAPRLAAPAPARPPEVAIAPGAPPARARASHAPATGDAAHAAATTDAANTSNTSDTTDTTDIAGVTRDERNSAGAAAIFDLPAPDRSAPADTHRAAPPAGTATHADAAPKGSALTPPSFESVDALVASLRQGKAVFNVPTDIDLDDTCPCRIDFMIDVRKSFSEMESILRRDHPEAKRFEHDDVKMAPLMEASLSADPDDVLISPKGRLQRAVSSTEPTTWTWMITPRTWGRHTLRLDLTVPFIIDGTSHVREIRTMSKNIEITVTPLSLIRRFIEANWKWLWTALLIPLLSYVMKQRKRRRMETALSGGERPKPEAPVRRGRDPRANAMREVRGGHDRAPRRRAR